MPFYIYAQNLTRKWNQIKNHIIIEASSKTQKWLNFKNPPRKGRALCKDAFALEVNNESVILNSPDGKTVFSPFGRGIFRVYLNSNATEEGLLEQYSWTINLANKNSHGWRVTKTSTTAKFIFPLTSKLEARLHINTIDGTLKFHLGPDLVMADLLPPQTHKEWLLIKKNLLLPNNVKVFGMGENTHPMNKAGQRIIMWNTDCYNYQKGTNPLYQSWPVVIYQFSYGPAFGMVFDNPGYSVFDFSPDGKVMNYAVQDKELNYFILVGPTMPELMQQLTTLTGRLPPLPKWSLGYQQSRWSYMNSSRVREIAVEFRKRDIPCDVIYLDIDYMELFKCFTWGKGFQDYKDLIRDLHSQGFKIVTIMDPGLKIQPGYQAYETGLRQKLFVRNRKGAFLARKVWAGSSHFPDFINPSAREWWAQLIDEFVRPGVDGIWCDMNEPSTFDCRRTIPPHARHTLAENVVLSHKKVHNLYGFLMSRATWEGLRKCTRLPYVITRSTYLGGQKYAVTWTGDNQSNWDHLRASIPMILNLGLSGQPVSGPDIGGFRGTPTPELYQRWILQGALYPYSRSHTMRGTGDQEPWSFGPGVEASARKAIKFRYRLVPYFYSLLFQATQSGQPIMRPIFYHTPTRDALKPEFYETQFLLGPNLLVAPLMNQDPTRACYLPPGKWYSWWCRKQHAGERVYNTLADEDTDLPVFIKENSIIPLYPEAPSHIPDKSLKDLEIMVVATIEAEATVVEYFDSDSLLAYNLQALVKRDRVEVKMDYIIKGSIPAGYQPPETLYFLLNHKVTRLEGGVYKDCLIKPDSINDAWTRITIKNPVLPFKGNFIFGSAGIVPASMAAHS